MFNAGERSRLVGVVLVLAFEGCCAGLPPRPAEQPELPAAEFAPCPRHTTGRSAQPANSMPGVPSLSTFRSGDPGGAALTGLQLMRMGSSGVTDGRWLLCRAVGVGVGGVASGLAASREGRQQLLSVTYDRLRAVRDV